MGRTLIALGQDSLGIQNLHKALQLDSGDVELYGEIANALWAKKKYAQAGDAYALEIQKGGRKVTLNDYFKEGLSYYFSVNANKPDTAVLNKADSALSYVQHKTTNVPAVVYLYRARINDTKDLDRNNIKGYAKPYYELYLTAIAAKNPPSDLDKKEMAKAYDYLGSN